MPLMHIDKYLLYGRSTAPDKLYSGGVGPCIVIGALYENNAYMLHSLPGKDFTTNMDLILNDLKSVIIRQSRSIENKELLKIFLLLGNNAYHENNEKEILFKKLEENGFSENIRVRIGYQEGFIYSLELNPANGIAIYRKTSDLDYSK